MVLGNKSEKKAIKLKVENHQWEFDLQNILNIFKPYMGPRQSEYVVISKVDGDCVSASVVQGDKVIGISSLCVQSADSNRGLRQGAKKTLYTVLAQVTGQDMPWGVLTGIRPTKIVHHYKNKKYTESSIKEKLIEDYCISQEKADLMIEIANEEGKVLSKNKEDEISLYIGIPFCPTRCLYCSFTSYSLKEKSQLVDEYLDALIKEIKAVASWVRDRPIRSLYIGGGTPTSLDHRQLERLLKEVDTCFNIDSIEEYTVEAGRPDTLSQNKLRLMKKYHVGRISINPQTMSQKTLDAVGRGHTVEDIIATFRMAREEGHENINMDLIIGLPEESTDDVVHTVDELAKLKPDSITVHTLAIKRASRLKQELKEYDLAKMGEVEKMLAIAAKGAEKMGMQPYYMYRQKDTLGTFENIGYAMPGKESIYNIQMIAEQQTIIAMGAGAVTKIVSSGGKKIERVPNVRNLEQYIQRIDEMIERKVGRDGSKIILEKSNICDIPL